MDDPDGRTEEGETIRECAARECREETGLDVETLGLVGVFSDPSHVIAYRDGEVRQPVNVYLFARPVGGELTTTDEASEVRWVDPADIDDYPMAPPLRRRLAHGLDDATEPHID